jgi:hypothetical protein
VTSEAVSLLDRLMQIALSRLVGIVRMAHVTQFRKSGGQQLLIGARVRRMT